MRATAFSLPRLSAAFANTSAHAGMSESPCTKLRRPSTASKTLSPGNRPWLRRLRVVRSDGRRSNDFADRAVSLRLAAVTGGAVLLVVTLRGIQRCLCLGRDAVERAGDEDECGRRDLPCVHDTTANSASTS
jgi:hypothetical protein